VFVGAFSAVFIVLGTAVGLLGSYFLNDHQRDLEKYAGLMLVGLGGLLVPSVKSRDSLGAALVLVLVRLRFARYLTLTVFARTFEVRVGERREVGYVKSALVGGAFAIG
jgi:cytochrome c biogenesis protein CcdA